VLQSYRQSGCCYGTVGDRWCYRATDSQAAVMLLWVTGGATELQTVRLLLWYCGRQVVLQSYRQSGCCYGTVGDRWCYRATDGDARSAEDYVSLY
jgi:hypothetical protein